MVTDIEKLVDFIVENRTCSMLDNKIGRFYRQTKSADYAWQIFVGRFYWQTKSANLIDRLTSP